MNTFISVFAIIRKKGVVRDTRKKLLGTFYYLSFPERREMLSAFLQSGKMDRRWAYIYIKRYWDYSFQNMTEEAWGKYMDKECAPIILRYSSEELINRYAAELSMRDYLGYCLRVGKKSSIEIDENQLSEHEYLYVMAKLHRQIDSDKINPLLYSTIASCLLEYDYDSLIHEYSFGKVGQIIWYAGEARCWNELVDFFEWKKSIRETTLASRFTKGDRENFKALFIAYSYVYFPAKYAHLLGDRFAHYTNLLSMKDGEKLAIEEIRSFI